MLRGHGDGNGALIEQALAHLGLGENSLRLTRELSNHWLWRAGWCNEGDPGGDLKALHARLDKRGHGGQAVHGTGATHRASADFSSANVLD